VKTWEVIHWHFTLAEVFLLLPLALWAAVKDFLRPEYN